MTADLGPKHEPLTELFSVPADAASLAGYRLSDDQLASWERDGYIAGIDILNDEQTEALREDLKGLMTPDHPGRELFHEYHLNESGDPDNVLFHALGAWRISPAFHDMLWNPAFTVPASQLVGGAVRFWHDQLFCKPARHGGVVAWHQDYSYWTRTKPLAHVTCWIGLDDSSRDNGCLMYVPGSHKWDLLPITGLAGDMGAIRKVLTDEQWDALQNPVAIEMKRGQGSFHHGLLVHGSEKNRTDRPRRACVINAFRDGVLSDSDEPLLKGIPAVPKGRKMEGPWFPLLGGDAARAPARA